MFCIHAYLRIMNFFNIKMFIYDIFLKDIFFKSYLAFYLGIYYIF